LPEVKVVAAVVIRHDKSILLSTLLRTAIQLLSISLSVLKRAFDPQRPIRRQLLPRWAFGSKAALGSSLNRKSRGAEHVSAGPLTTDPLPFSVDRLIELLKLDVIIVLPFFRRLASHQLFGRSMGAALEEAR
jgi:hypothetical protein